MDQPASHFTPLLIVVFLAFLVPVILARFKKLHLPIVVGEILVGILIGRSGFGWVSPDEPILDFIAEFGFVFLMFLSGMEIDFSSLGFIKNRSRNIISRPLGPLPLALITFGLTVSLAGLLSLGMVQLGMARNIWMMALILSTTSLGVVVPVLKENGLVGSQLGQSILFAALIADFATMFLITILVTVLSHGITFRILLITLLFVAFFVILRFGQLFNRLPGARRAFEELSHATAQIKVRAAFTMMLAFVVLSYSLGTEIILGAFLAGACIALLVTPADESIMHQLETIGYGFLIPVFFIKVGIDVNLSALLSSSRAMLLAPVLTVAALIVKVGPALAFRLRFNWREALSAGALLSVRLSLIIAASAIGTQLGVISEATNAAILVVALLTVTFAPVAFSALTSPVQSKAQRPIVIVGAGELGLLVAGQLQAHQEKLIILDGEEERVERARQRGFPAQLVALEANDPKARDALVETQTLICTYGDTEQNFRACQVARVNYGIRNVIARITTAREITRFEQLGVITSNAALDHAFLLTMLARNPATYALLTRTDDNKEIYEVMVENPTCANRPLRQLRLPGDTLVLAVMRNGELLVPHGDTQIFLGDSVTLVSSLEWVALGQQVFSFNNQSL